MQQKSLNKIIAVSYMTVRATATGAWELISSFAPVELKHFLFISGQLRVRLHNWTTFLSPPPLRLVIRRLFTRTPCRLDLLSSCTSLFDLHWHCPALWILNRISGPSIDFYFREKSTNSRAFNAVYGPQHDSRAFPRRFSVIHFECIAWEHANEQFLFVWLQSSADR